jgi:RNA polymerase primary sigma factor
MESFDPVQLYFREIKMMEQIPREEMAILWGRASRGDKRSQKRLVEANLRLVIPLAKKYFRHGIDFLDLIEEGNMGLMRAVEKFDPGRNVHFSTYATYWIDQAVRRAVEEQGKTIRIPPHVWDAIHRWLKFWKPMKEKLGRDPTSAEMAKKLSLSVRQIEDIMRASRVSQGTSSLETPIDEEGSIFIKDVISDKKSHTPESISEMVRQHSDIDQALNMLPAREKTIVQLRFGLGGKEPESLEEVGDKLKLSRERIRQLEKRALSRLKSITMRLRIIDTRTAKKLPIDSRQESPDRRQGKPDRRARPVERRKAPDRRAARQRTVPRAAVRRAPRSSRTALRRR